MHIAYALNADFSLSLACAGAVVCFSNHYRTNNKSNKSHLKNEFAIHKVCTICAQLCRSIAMAVVIVEFFLVHHVHLQKKILFCAFE